MRLVRSSCLPGKSHSSGRSLFHPSVQHIHFRHTSEVHRSARPQILDRASSDSARNDVLRITHFRHSLQRLGDFRHLTRHSKGKPFICPSLVVTLTVLPQSFAASCSVLLARSWARGFSQWNVRASCGRCYALSSTRVHDARDAHPALHQGRSPPPLHVHVQETGGA